VRDLSCGGRTVYLEIEIRRVSCKTCGVKQEHLPYLSPNKSFTQRFAWVIGDLCRAMSVKDVAKRMGLHWHTVKDLDKIYMREQIRLAGHPSPRAIGIDEISIRKGHEYRIVVSDLDEGRAIWFGGKGRTEEDMDQFFAFLGEENSQKIKLAVMDMWKPFRKSTKRHAPDVAIIFDKFHILSHLSNALDIVRRSEYKRVESDRRGFIKGQRYVLLSKRGNLSDNGRKNLEKLLQENSRLNVAYLLREQFEQLWSYTNAEHARTFFDNWRDQLQDHDLPSYKKFAAMVHRHWDGIMTYCHPDNKVPLGFVEGLNNKIRVIQRRAYGLCDEDYLALKILTTNLPPL
jgi:transposase